GPGVAVAGPDAAAVEAPVRQDGRHQRPDPVAHRHLEAAGLPQPRASLTSSSRVGDEFDGPAGSLLTHPIEEDAMQRIIPNLWFSHEAAEAADYYVGILGGKVLSTFGEGPVDPSGTQQPVTVEFEALDMRFVAINGGLDGQEIGRASCREGAENRV